MSYYVVGVLLVYNWLVFLEFLEFNSPVFSDPSIASKSYKVMSRQIPWGNPWSATLMLLVGVLLAGWQPLVCYSNATCRVQLTRLF